MSRTCIHAMNIQCMHQAIVMQCKQCRCCVWVLAKLDTTSLQAPASSDRLGCLVKIRLLESLALESDASRELQMYLAHMLGSLEMACEDSMH